MFSRDLPECARTYLTDAYAKARHYGGKFDEMMQKAAVGYQAAVPLVAAAADAYGTPLTEAGAKCYEKDFGSGAHELREGETHRKSCRETR